MKFCLLSLMLLFFIGLISCTDEAAKARKDTKTEESVISENSAQIKETLSLDKRVVGHEIAKSKEAEELSHISKSDQENPKDLVPTDEEVREANRIISFINQCRDILNGGIYKTAAILKNNALFYRENWVLPKRPKLPAKHSSNPNLQPIKGIFSEAEEKQLTLSLADMDKELNEILLNYKQLEKYINDSSIIDDGKRGLELSKNLLQSYDRYIKARKNWLGILEAKAEEAEVKLLYRHPLERQILSAKSIFAQMRKIEELTNSETNKREELNALCQDLNNIIAEAAKPPFQASAALERLYKVFLKEVQNYCIVLERGTTEGFHNVQKRELKAASLKCQRLYNEFVNAANKLAE